MLNAAELNDAHRIAGWDESEADREFEKFRDWYLEKNLWRGDWSAAWRKWCDKGRTMDERSRQQESRTGVRSAAAGLTKWLDRQQG